MPLVMAVNACCDTRDEISSSVQSARARSCVILASAAHANELLWPDAAGAMRQKVLAKLAPAAMYV